MSRNYRPLLPSAARVDEEDEEESVERGAAEELWDVWLMDGADEAEPDDADEPEEAETETGAAAAAGVGVVAPGTDLKNGWSSAHAAVMRAAGS